MPEGHELINSKILYDFKKYKKHKKLIIGFKIYITTQEIVSDLFHSFLQITIGKNDQRWFPAQF